MYLRTKSVSRFLSILFIGFFLSIGFLITPQFTAGQEDSPAFTSTGEMVLQDVSPAFQVADFTNTNTNEYRYWTRWICRGTEGGVCDLSHYAVYHNIITVVPSTETVTYKAVLPSLGSCTITSPTSIICNGGSFPVGSIMPILFIVNYSSGATSFQHNAISNAGTWIHTEQLEPSECVTVNAIKACAADLEGNKDGTVYTGSANIRLNNSLRILSGSLVAKPKAGTINITGEVFFLADNVPGIPFWNGSATFNSGQTASGEMTFGSGGGGWILGKLSELAVDTTRLSQMQVMITANSALRVTGGGLKLVQPIPASLTLRNYTVDSSGNVSGAVEPFQIRQAPFMKISVEEAAFSEKGLLSSGTIDMGYINLDVPVPFDDILITSETFGQDAELTAAGAGLNFNQKMIFLGPVCFQLGKGQIEASNLRNKGLEISILVSDISAQINTPAAISSMSCEPKKGEEESYKGRLEGGIRIFGDGVSVENVTLKVPKFKVFKFDLADIEFGFETESVDPFRFALNGEGALVVPNFIRRSSSDSVGLFFGLKVKVDNGKLKFQNLQGGLNGLEIPLGTTGTFLTEFGGKLNVSDNKPEENYLEGNAKVEAGPQPVRALGIKLISGDVALRGSWKGWAELDGSVQLFDEEDFQLAEAGISINKPGESAGGAAGEFRYSIMDILLGRGHLSWTTEGFSGRLRGTLQIPFNKLPTYISVFLPYDNLVLGDVQGFVGKHNDKYGAGASGHFNLIVTQVFVCAFVNTDLQLDFNCGWVEVSQETLAQLPQVSMINMQRGIAGVRVGSTTIGLTDDAQAVIFILANADATSSTLTLLDPDGHTIDPSNVSSYPNIALGNNGSAFAYVVTDPIPGIWTANIVGDSTGPIQVIVQDNAPTIRVSDVIAQSDGSQLIRWRARDTENPAGQVTLFYDTDKADFDGLPFAIDVPAEDGEYLWTGDGIRKGEYYVYADLSDGTNFPQTSRYFANPIPVSDKVRPATPTNLAVVLTDENTATLNWDDNTEADLAEYQVLVSYSETPDTSFVVPLSESAATIELADRSQDITLQVRAVDMAKNRSEPTQPWVIGKLDVKGPKAPKSFQAELLYGDFDLPYVLVSWELNTETDLGGYDLYYGYGSNPTFDGVGLTQGPSPIHMGKVNTIQLDDLQYGRTLNFFIVPFDTDSNAGRASNLITIEVPTPTVFAPTRLTAAYDSLTNQVKVIWQDPNTNEDSYVVEREIAGSEEWEVVVSTFSDVTEFNDAGTTCGVTHAYRVRAYRSMVDVYSNYSNLAFSYTIPCSGQDNLLKNGSFDDSAGKVPIQWKGKGLGVRDKLICIGSGFDGTCAFRFRGEQNKKSVLSQAVNVSGLGLGVGDTLAFGAYILPSKVSGVLANVTIVYTDGVREKFRMRASPSHSKAYTGIGANIVLANNADRIIVSFSYRAAKGGYLVDRAVLTAHQNDLPLSVGGEGLRDITP